MPGFHAQSDRCVSHRALCLDIMALHRHFGGSGIYLHGLLTLAVFMEKKQSMGEWEQSILPYISLGTNAVFSSMRSVFCWFSFPGKAGFVPLKTKARVNIHLSVLL